MQGNEWEIHAVRGPSSDFVRIGKDSWTLIHQLRLWVQHPIPSIWLVANLYTYSPSKQQQTLFAISVQCNRRTTKSLTYNSCFRRAQNLSYPEKAYYC